MLVRRGRACEGDADGDPTLITTSQANPDGSMRTSYARDYYDAADRETATVNFGTDGASAAADATVPARSSAVQVNSETFDAGGFKNSSTDPNGTITEDYNDSLGRPVKTIVNFGGTPATSVDQTFFGYDGMNHTTSTTVVNNMPGGAFQDQTTLDIYGVTIAGGSSINSNDLLGEVRYPGYGTAGYVATDATSAYDRQGDRTVWNDRDGNAHNFTFDSLGRETNEKVTPASGIDSTVTDLGYAFDSAGNPDLFTSYNAGGTPLNQVQRTYNGFGQVAAELQNNSGAVTSPGTVTVGYGYSSASTGSIEDSLTYPDGRTETYGLSPIGQVINITDSPSAANSAGQVIENLQYLGLNTLIGRTLPQAGISLAVNLNNLNQVGSLTWSNAAGPIDGYTYVYNADGAVTSRGDAVNSAFSESYGLDPLNRMTSFSRGGQTLASWNLDTQGNKYNGPYTGGYNDYNQLIINGASNALDAETTVALTPAWDTSPNDLQTATITYNSWDQVVGTLASNSNTIPNPKDRYDYDALGRLIDVKVLNSDGTTSSSTRYIYDGSNVIEERDGNGNVTAQYVWAPDGSLILRDRNTGAGAAGDTHIPQGTNANGSATALNERLYAVSDAAGSITAVTSISGTVVERYIYNQDGAPTILQADWTPYPATSAGGGAWSPYNWQYLFHGMRGESMDLNSNGVGDRVVTGLYQSNGGWYNPVQGVSLQPNYAAADAAGANPYDVTGMTINWGLVSSVGLVGLGIAAGILTGGLATAAIGACEISALGAATATGVELTAGGTLAVAAAGGAGGGALASGFGAYGQGASASGIAKASAIGLFSGAVGGLAGGAAGLGVRGLVNAAGINCAAGLGTGGASLIGAAEGSVGGFVGGGIQGGLTTGTLQGAWRGAWQGGLTGGILGGGLGALLHNACFAAGTPMLLAEEITLPDGRKSAVVVGSLDAEQVREGHVFLSGSEFDPSAPLAAKVVEEVFVRAGVIFLVYVGGRVIRTTPEHEFMVRDKGRVPATDLEPGDLLPGHKGGWTAVERTENTGKVEPVYNFRIADYHTYFVGRPEWGFSVWAHNKYTGNSTDLGNGVELRTYEITSSKTGGIYYRKIAYDTNTGEADFSRFYLLDENGDPVMETIQLTGSRKADFALANNQQGVEQPADYTWHHLNYDSDTGTGQMVLVQTDVHRAVGHSGGVSEYVAATGVTYRD